MSSASAALRLMMDLMLEWKSTTTVSANMMLLLCLSVHGCLWQTWYGACSQWAESACQYFPCPTAAAVAGGNVQHAAQCAAHSVGDGDCELVAAWCYCEVICTWVCSEPAHVLPSQGNRSSKGGLAPKCLCSAADIFPDEGAAAPNLKLLEAAQAWKRRKLEADARADA